MVRYAAFSGWFLLTLGLLVVPTAAQPPAPALIPAKSLEAFQVRNVGPANMSGRIVDLVGVESDPNTQYVAVASGGLWKTVNDGKSWEAVFDGQPTQNIGAVAVSQSNPSIVWVGTGEANPRNSVAWGDGVYQSTDGGKTWQNKGLKDTQHIGRVVIHPKNPDIVYVAALGHIWGPNKERGIFKTTDGGKTWDHTLALDENTGCIDVAIDLQEPDSLYAAAYAVKRDAFSGGNPATQFGPKAGLYKTSDGGKNWAKMTEGLPKLQIGRSGIAVSRKDPKIVYAVVQTPRTTADTTGQSPNEKVRGDAKKKKGKDDDDAKDKESDQGQSPSAFDVSLVQKAGDPITPDDGGIFRSEDRGKTWKQINSLCPRPFYYGQIRIDPNNDLRLYVLGVQFYVTSDGGVTFNTQQLKGVHVDHHALWINPADSKHVILGNDGGLYYSRDKAVTFEPQRSMSIGQFYAIAVDMRQQYRVYGGLQDNGSWGGPTATTRAEGITLADWINVGGGDGFYCACDPTNPNIVYSESQYGAPRRMDLSKKGGGKKGGGGGQANIKPGGKGTTPYEGQPLNKEAKNGNDAKNGNEAPEDPQAKGGGKGGGLRFNWSSPLIISPHNPATLFYGGNVLFRSDNRGDTWKTVSPDVTRNQKAPNGHTLSTIAESPAKAGILWTGSDDGMVCVSRDGGAKWTDVSTKLPGPAARWITRVEPSLYGEGTCYVSFSRYRNDDRKPYVYKTSDFGETWQPLMNNLPADSAVHVIKESSRNPNLLFIGIEHGLFVSLDAGKTWQRFGKGLPPVAVHDLVIHPRDRDLVIGTHGRSIYVVDIGPLEEWNAKVAAAGEHLFAVRRALSFVPKAGKVVTRDYQAPNPAYGATIWLNFTGVRAAATLEVLDAKKQVVAMLPIAIQKGIQSVVWNLKTADGKTEVPPGAYTVQWRAGTATLTRPLVVEALDTKAAAEEEQ